MTAIDPPGKSQLPSFTLEQVMSFHPCYDEAKVRTLFDGRDRLTARDALDLPIPAEDRIWIATREGVLPDAIFHEWACRDAEAALATVAARGEAIDPRSRAAIAAKRAWLRGEIGDVDLDAAWAAAWAAASAAASAAARSAAWADSIDRLRILLAE